MATRDKSSEITQTPQEAGGVERTAEPDTPSIKGAETFNAAPAAERTVLTAEPKRSADKTSAPGGEAFPEDPPLRTTRPDVPIVDSLATGAGAHVPPDPEVYTWDGRLRDLVEP